MKALIIIIVILAICISGCAPALIGAIAYSGGKDKQEKQKFMADFRATNIEREKAGLEPLNLCIEMYYFDRGWAQKNADCRAVIDSLEAVNR